MKMPSDELRKKLFDIEVSLYLTQEDLEEIKLKLTLLNRLHQDLMYNIDLHKSGSVTTSIMEYKKTLKDIKKTRTEIEGILKTQRKLEESLSNLVKSHDSYTAQYEQVSALEEEIKVVEIKNYAKSRRSKK